MSEQQNNQAGINDPMDLRNTETAKLKRMPVDGISSGSSASKKTIKLKPLVPQNEESMTDTVPLQTSQKAAAASQPVPAPTILLSRPAAPAQENAASTPQFMSTATAPISKMDKPDTSAPFSASNLGSASTMKPSIPVIPKPAAQPTVTAAASGISTATVAVSKIAKAAPKPATTASSPIPKYTVTATAANPKLQKQEPAAPAATAPKYVATATSAMPKVDIPKPESPMDKNAIGTTPKYVATSTAAMPKADIPKQENPVDQNELASKTASSPNLQEAINQAKMQSGLQSAKPAVKLRPSATPSAVTTLSSSSPTVKLQLKTESAVSPVPAEEQAPAAAPAPAEAPQNPEMTTKIPRLAKTPVLKKPVMPAPVSAPAPAPVAPDAPTPKPAEEDQASLRQQDNIAKANLKSGVDGDDQVIKIAEEKKEEEETPITPVVKKKSSSEPNILFAISAIIAFLVIGYTVFALAAQYVNKWEGKEIPVVGFQQIDEAMKK